MTVRIIPVVLTAINTPVKLMDLVPGGGATVVVTNGSATNPIFLGQSASVTTSNGGVIAPYGSVTLTNATSSLPLYAVAGAVDSGGTKVGVFYGDSQPIG